LFCFPLLRSSSRVPRHRRRRPRVRSAAEISSIAVPLAAFVAAAVSLASVSSRAIRQLIFPPEQSRSPQLPFSALRSARCQSPTFRPSRSPPRPFLVPRDFISPRRLRWSALSSAASCLTVFCRSPRCPPPVRRRSSSADVADFALPRSQSGPSPRRRVLVRRHDFPLSVATPFTTVSAAGLLPEISPISSRGIPPGQSLPPGSHPRPARSCDLIGRGPAPPSLSQSSSAAFWSSGSRV
jgi:hypothetical protein